VSVRKVERAAVSLEHVSVTLRTRLALEDVTAALCPGAIVGVVGPNGAGKTTLLRALVGVVPLTEGRIRIHGQPPRAAWRQLGYLPQHEQVNWEFPVSALEVVLMGQVRRLGWSRRPGAADYRIARNALATVGMEQHAERQIGQLSGGQRQRVFLARALAQARDVLVLDEPLAGVDATTQEVIIRLLADLRDQGKLVLMSTHDLGLALEACDHLLCLNQRLIASGPTHRVFTREVLRATYGAAVALLDGGLAVHDVHH
jgi:manganese/zinc/iron transport system ATP- binding protein